MEKHAGSYNLIIAPHEVNKDHIEQLMEKFGSLSPQIYSKADKNTVSLSNILVIDSIGLLSYLYRYAKIAYVGGGFGVGIHNLLEAVTYGIPVVFGPNFNKFKEAVDLLELHAGYTISDSGMCLEIFESLTGDQLIYKKSCNAAIDYVRTNSGATQQIIDKVKSYLIAR
jgi:3-deoxy-D-manno-octulosonic-acid transferase